MLGPKFHVRLTRAALKLSLLSFGLATPAFAQSNSTVMLEQLILHLVVLSVLVVVGLLVLFIPAFVAFHRQHPNRWAIAVVCLAFGGTVIGWFGALVWAMQAVHKSPSGSDGGESGLNIFVNDPVPVRIEPVALGPGQVELNGVSQRLARLHQLADRGDISAEEHAALRQAILKAI